MIPRGRGSWQAHVASLVVRWFVRSRLRRVSTLLEARDVLDREHPVPRDVVRRADHVGEIPGEWIEAGSGSGTVLLYLHGGGYFAGSPATHRTITAAFARRGLRVFAADYRLAPEHPFPAALEDACAAYQALRIGAPAPRRIVLAGDSAGGGLALATLVALRDRGIPLPAACVLFSPWTDLSLSGERAGVPWEREMLDRVRPATEAYLAGVDPCDPLVSPLFADLRGLPPILIHAGADEALCADSTRLAAALRAAGGGVELRLWPVVPHVWQMVPRFLPEARESLDHAADFLETAAVARVVPNPRTSLPCDEESALEPMKPMKPMAPMKPMEPFAQPAPWWPAELGSPASSGSQNGMRYAFFPAARRLLVETDGRLDTYDSAEHRISGVAQAQSGERSLAFTSQDGAVALDALKRVE